MPKLFEGGYAPEKPKSEVELLEDEVKNTETELTATDQDSPEYGWLKERLESMKDRLKSLKEAVDVTAEVEMEEEDGGDKKEKAA